MSLSAASVKGTGKERDHIPLLLLLDNGFSRGETPPSAVSGDKKDGSFASLEAMLAAMLKVAPAVRVSDVQGAASQRNALHDSWLFCEHQTQGARLCSRGRLFDLFIAIIRALAV